MLGRTEKGVDDMCDGAMMRSIVALERVEVGINLLMMSNDECVRDADQRSKTNRTESN
jgi:hypothetical protein